MTTTVRYVPQGDNRVLRHVLRQVWDLRCYWCREFKDYNQLEIDHILPKDSSTAEQERLRDALDVPLDYDVHAVHNLAPICSPCNKLKSNEDLTQKPLVLSLLNKARKFAPKVVKGVQSFGLESELGEALLVAAEVDLTDSRIKATFEEGAFAIVQRLAELGEGKVDYDVHREVTVQVFDVDHHFIVSLNEEGRAAHRVLQKIAGHTLAEALSEPMRDLFRQTALHVEGALRDHDDGLGAPDVGGVDIEWPEIAVDRLTWDGADPGELQFEFEGSFEGSATGSVARDASDGDGLEHVQGDATFTCRYKFDLVWEDGRLYFDQVWLEDFEADTVVDGRGPQVWWDWPADDDRDSPES